MNVEVKDPTIETVTDALNEILTGQTPARFAVSIWCTDGVSLITGDESARRKTYGGTGDESAIQEFLDDPNQSPAMKVSKSSDERQDLYCLCHILLSLKHPNKSFLTQ